MDSNLIPCPFCGKKPDIYRLTDDNDRSIKYKVGCKNSNCDVCPETNRHYNVDDAINSWNRRY